MNLTLVRKYFKPDYTIGKLYVENEFVCDTLEDRYRDLTKEPKVYGKTAIPFGIYRVVLTKSARFGMVLPELLGVPQFTAIRIHGGNRPKDTEGCILVGKNSIPGALIESRHYLGLLMDRLLTARRIDIKIDNGDYFV